MDNFQMGKGNLKEMIERVIKEKGLKIPEARQENKIQGWWYSDSEIVQAVKEDKMLTLDLDVGSTCHYNCSFCFAEPNRVEDNVKKKTARIIQIIDEAAELGIRNLKIVGAGEPTLFPNLVKIVKYAFEKYGIVSIIFSSGDIFGNDALASSIYSNEGIKSGLELAKKFYELKSSIIIKYPTLDREKEKVYCGVSDKILDFKVQGLMNLIKVGFNSTVPTRLGVDFLMLKGIEFENRRVIEGNYLEAVQAFELFNKYNIFMVLNTSMDCGNTSSTTSCARRSSTKPLILSQEEAYHVAKELYTFAINNKIPFDKRISPYFLSPVCSQLNHGLYVADNGLIKNCPGQPLTERDLQQGKKEPYLKIYSEKGDLKKVWENNQCKKCPIGHKCISRCGKTYFPDFEERLRVELSLV